MSPAAERRGWKPSLAWAVLGGLPVAAMALAGPLRLGTSAWLPAADAVMSVAMAGLFAGVAVWEAKSRRRRTPAFVAVFSLTVIALSNVLAFLVAV